MRRTRRFGGPALLALGLGLTVGGCSAGNDVGDQQNASPPSSAEPSAPTAARDSALIDVAAGSKVSLGLRGGAGPVIAGQTVTKAMVTMQDVQLVSASGATVPLLRDSVTTDLLAVQDDLRPLIQEQGLDAGQFTQVRFRLTSAWIQTVDDQGTNRVFATEQADRSQFSSIQTVNQLQLAGLDNDGFCTVALPQDGIHVAGSASLALTFALSESLSVQSDTVWALDPRVWIVDQSIFSSVDVQFASSESYQEYFAEGFRVMLLDTDNYPVCETSLVEQSSVLFVASFRYVEYFRGPFTAVLVPPRGFSLASSVAVSIDVQQSVRIQTSVSVQSVQRISGDRRGGTLEIRADNQAQITARSQKGDVVHQGTTAVGPIDQVMPHTPSKEPVKPGEQPPHQAPPPNLPGVPTHGGTPAAQDGGAPPPSHDAGGPPPTHDAGGPPPTDAGGPPPTHDAGGPPPTHDAGGPPPTDAGGPPPTHDAGGPPPTHDAGGPPPTHDAGGPPPSHDAGGPPPSHDAGGPPPSHDAGRPSTQPGGQPPSGGTPPAGGTPPSGGTPPTGGKPPSGGTPPSGGKPPSGGTSPSGGMPPSGGAPPSGGKPPSQTAGGPPPSHGGGGGGAPDAGHK